jgi:hypothetical protein
VLPTWSLPFFFEMHLDEKMKNENETKNEKKKEAKVRRHHLSSSSPASSRRDGSMLFWLPWPG